ncbi:hypothetical protein FISHEDRAFT_13189, partial [Fistulina hepatica ATCC 64428]
ELHENVGSTTRDFLMIERNVLAHLRLALTLFFLACSTLVVHSSIWGRDASVALASVEMFAAVLAIIAGAYQYERMYRAVSGWRAFILPETRPHLVLMSIVSVIIFGLCILYI